MIDTQKMLAAHGSIAPLSSERLDEIKSRAYFQLDHGRRGRHIQVAANEAIELVAASLALTDAQAVFDAQTAEIAEAKGQIEHLDRQNNALRDALGSIRQYGNDTLSGRADGGPDDRKWQREAVIEMRNRARAALSGESNG